MTQTQKPQTLTHMCRAHTREGHKHAHPGPPDSRITGAWLHTHQNTKVPSPSTRANPVTFIFARRDTCGQAHKSAHTHTAAHQALGTYSRPTGRPPEESRGRGGGDADLARDPPLPPSQELLGRAPSLGLGTLLGRSTRPCLDQGAGGRDRERWVGVQGGRRGGKVFNFLGKGPRRS